MEKERLMSKNYGAVAYFKTPEEILKATRAATAAGYKNHDAFTPFPVHGIDEALALKPSIVPWATLICGLTGFSIATHMQIWTSAFDWPLNVGGRPLLSIPAFLPIMFELTVLLGGLGTVAFMFFLNGLPNLKPMQFDPRISDDRFALYIPFEGQKQSEGEIQSFLNTLGAEKVSLVTERV
jgi:hypothetical protein